MLTKGIHIRRATTAEIIKIAAILTKVIKKHKDGTVYYEDGQTDESVAGQIGNGLSEYAITRIRKELHGVLPKGRRGTHSVAGTISSSLVKRVENIEAILRTQGYKDI